MEKELEHLPRLIDRDGFHLCSDGKYRHPSQLKTANLLIAKLDKDIRMYKDINSYLVSQLPKDKSLAAGV